MKTRKIVTLALLVSLNVVVARLFLIPVAFTHGNINLSDVGIVIAALAFGSQSGALVGGLSGFLLDLLSGYPQYMLFSLVIHGTQGAVVGMAYAKPIKEQVLACSLALFILVGGYFMADSLLYGWSAGILGLATNFLQGAVGMSVGLVVARKFPRLKA